MIKSISVLNFKPIPYLETSSLMSAHNGKVEFSTEKVNVIVGPNGAGKSALIFSLAHLLMAYPTGVSAFDDYYIRWADEFWNKEKWYSETFMTGITFEGDLSPALFYKPNHIPGDETSLTHSMMTGYSKQSREWSDKTRKKSSGQKSIAMLDRVFYALDGSMVIDKFEFINWGYSKEVLEQNDRNRSHLDTRSQIVLKQYSEISNFPVILMDEPEQSLDALNEFKLWQAISSTDLTNKQVIVASHSLYPFMHLDKFNLIEAVPGYIDSVMATMNGSGKPSSDKPNSEVTIKFNVDADDDFELSSGFEFEVKGSSLTNAIESACRYLNFIKVTWAGSWAVVDDDGNEVESGSKDSSWFCIRDKAIEALNNKELSFEWGGNASISYYISN